MPHRVYFGDNLLILQSLPSESIDLIYIDPPFNTGKVQARTQIKTHHSENGDRVGFQGQRYETVTIGKQSYADLFDDFLGFIEPRLLETYRVLKPQGSLYFHIDYREVHYCKVLLDGIFGRPSFLNDIIWAYDYGARTKRKWPAKHDNILWYAKDPQHYTYNVEDIERIPYMAPGLVGPEKAAAANCPRIPGGTPSSPPTVQKRPATPPKSRWESYGALSGPLPTRARPCWISSLAQERPGPLAWSWAGSLSWWITTRRRCR